MPLLVDGVPCAWADDASPMVGKALMFDPDRNPEPGTCNVAISVDSRYVPLTANNTKTVQVQYDGLTTNRPPVAFAKWTQTGQAVMLDGTSSRDPDGNSLTYQWRQTGGASVILVGDGTPTPTFEVPDSKFFQAFTFELVVNDGRLNSKPSTISLFIPGTG